MARGLVTFLGTMWIVTMVSCEDLSGSPQVSQRDVDEGANELPFFSTNFLDKVDMMKILGLSKNEPHDDDSPPQNSQSELFDTSQILEMICEMIYSEPEAKSECRTTLQFVAAAMELGGFMRCEMCQFVTSMLKDKFKEQEFRAMAQAVFMQISSNIPGISDGRSRELVMTYIDQAAKLMEENINLEEVCSMIGICDAPTSLVSEESYPNENDIEVDVSSSHCSRPSLW